MEFTDIEFETWPRQSSQTPEDQAIALKPKFQTRTRLKDRRLYRDLQTAWLEKLSVNDLDLITDMLANLAENRADKYYLLVAKMLTVVFRDKKSADQVIEMLPTMTRDALIYVLDKNSWRGDETRIFVEYPETGQEDRMSCWNQRLQLYRGIKEGISKLSFEYDKDLANDSQPLPDLGDLSSHSNIEHRKDIWAMAQQQGDEAFVEYFDRWRALAANVFQMTQLPREEITFLYPIVKEYSTRLKLHCIELERSIQKIDQGAQHMQETKRKQQQSIEMLKEEIRASKEVLHNSVVALQLLLSRFGARINSKTRLAVTSQQRIEVPLNGSEEEKARGEDKIILRLEVPQLFKDLQAMVVGIERMFEHYELQIENQQDHLNATLASLSSAEENVKQLRHKSAGDADRIETLTKDLQLREEDVNKVTERLIERQNIISDMEDRLAANCRWGRSGGEKYTSPVDSQQYIQESRSCYCTQKVKTEEDNNKNKLGSEMLADSKKEIRELKEEIAGKDTVIQKLASDLNSLRKSYEQQSLEHGSVRTERDTLLSRLHQVQETVERQSEEPTTFKGKHSELVGWTENQARRSRASEEHQKTLQYQQVNQMEKHKQTVEDKDQQIRDLRKVIADGLIVKEERDKLELILYQLKEVVGPHVEGKLSFENGYTHLISWVKKQSEEHNAAREGLNTRQINQDTQPMEPTKRLKLEMNSKDIETLKQQVEEATQVITEEPPAIQTSLKNDKFNTEKSMGDQGNITTCMNTNKLPDSYNRAITQTNQMERILSFFFDRYICEINATRSKNELLQKQLDNIDGRLDIYIKVLKCEPVCALAESLSFNKAHGGNDSQGGIIDKLDLLIRWMSEKFREGCPDKCQAEAEVVQRTHNIQTTSIMSNRKTGKTSPLQHWQLSNYQSNTKLETAKQPTPPQKAPMIDEGNLSDVEATKFPSKAAVAVKQGRTLRSATRRQRKGLEDSTALFHVRVDKRRVV